MRWSLGLVTLVGWCVAVGVTGGCREPQSARPSPNASRPVDIGDLKNVVAFHEGVLSGARPEGQQPFQTLAEWGVRTIITVDAVPIDVERGRAAGMRVAHVPWGYGRPSRQSILEVAASVRRGLSRGAVYVHCHHGRHRSAAAAAIGLIALDLADGGEMTQRMAVSGADRGYRGLWEAVDAVTPLALEEVASVGLLPERVEPTGLRAIMVTAEDALEQLRQCRSQGWGTGDAVAWAGGIVDSLRELNRLAIIEGLGPEAAAWVEATIAAASNLERHVKDSQSAPASAALDQLEASCRGCHRVTR
ncbi:MAG: hypothetical protein QGG74_06945 [Phycisphaerales bacterium]|jgi:hypothetical protein|nr:hypothetical protein [Phycisphaerales bacterium]